MFTTHTFWLQKSGLSPDEYEDASAVMMGESGLACAVADGATETSFSSVWARLLAEGYVRGALRTLDDVAALSPAWRSEIDALTRDKPLPWYAEEKLSYGSFAALVGLHLRRDGGWTALASGDCCVFHLRGGALTAAFPLDSADAFNNRPLLLSTLPERNTAELRAISGRWQKDDVFFLASDALAQFLLRHPLVLDKFRTLRARSFAPLIERLRADKRCRNDDMTFVRVRIDAAPASSKSS
jgi:hypothetical protein